MSRLSLMVLTLAATGCTFDDGSGFATLERASLSARFEPGAREVRPNVVFTDLAYQVSLNKLALRVEELRLEEPSDDVSAFVLVAALPVEQELDLLAAPTLTLSRVEPSPELPQATLGRAALALRGLSISGSASGGTLAAPLSFEVDVAPLGSLSQALDFVVDRDTPETLALSAEVRLDGPLFDGVDFASLAGAQPLLLSDLDDPVVIQVALTALASSFSVVVAGN